jgi:hypothetical protein
MNMMPIELGTNGAVVPRLNTMEKMLVIQAQWDDQAKVWVATSDDVPGLATEAPTLELMTEKLQVMVPELLELNGGRLASSFPFEVLARRVSITHAH